MTTTQRKHGKKIALAALGIDAIGLSPNKPYTWASGWQSPIYNDNRKHLSYPKNRMLILAALVDTIKEQGIQFDGILGTSTSGIPWATLLADKLHAPLYILQNGKAYGFPRPALLSRNWESDIVAASAPRGLPLGIRVAHMADLPFVYVRAAKKPHGLQNQIEGKYTDGQTVCYVASDDPSSTDNKKALTEAGLTIATVYQTEGIRIIDSDIKGLKLLVIEDLISTAGSSMKEALDCRELGAEVTDIITIFNYDFPIGEKKAAEANVQVHSLCTYADVLEAAKETKRITEPNLLMLQNWNKDPEQWSDENGGTTFKKATAL